MESEDGQPLSPAMRSALQAVARMKGDAVPDVVLWVEFIDTLECRTNGGSDLQKVKRPPKK